MPGFPPMPVDIMTLKVHITNAEADRNVSIRAAYLLAKSRSGFALHEELFSAPSDPLLSAVFLNFISSAPVFGAPRVMWGARFVKENSTRGSRHG